MSALPRLEFRLSRTPRPLFAIVTCLLLTATGLAQAPRPMDAYKIFAGNTHSHTQFTWSHGEQWAKGPCAGILVYAPQPDAPYVSLWKDGYVKKNCPSIYVVNGLQYPAPGQDLRSDWQTVQGPPARHYEVAKQDGFDFYVTSDHSQEALFAPNRPDNPAWKTSKEQAAAATSTDFVALAGFEFSENDGPGGTGHINVINSDGILNALAPGVDLPVLYKWLATARPNGSGPVVAIFNHPGATQYADWADRTPAVTDIITMLEVINGNNHLHYDGFVHALDKGWKVSPVAGLDNHGLTAIGKSSARTFVLATANTKAGILEAMKNRRTYASLEKSIQCRYSVNGKVMGSTLNRPSSFEFSIHITDPDTSDPGHRITRIDILKDHGEEAQSYSPPAPGYDVTWTPTLHDTASKYFFVRVWAAGNGSDSSAAPVAWLAPVWTGR